MGSELGLVQHLFVADFEESRQNYKQISEDFKENE